MALLVEGADLPRLSITMNMGDCTWNFIQDAWMWEDALDLSMFRFIYDFYIDVVTAMCSLKGLGGVNLELSAFAHLRPWLEREVLGYERGRALQTPRARRLEKDLWRQLRFCQVLPPWHDMERRLEGSNYQPNQ